MSDRTQPPDAVDQLLLAEHQQSYEMYRYSEELGERRFNFFLTLITAVIAALVVADAPVVEGDDVAPAAYLLLFGLLLVGCVTLARIALRNENSFAQLLAVGQIRDWFLRRDEAAVADLELDWPKKDVADSKRVRPRREIVSFRRGGLDVTLQVINALIAGGLAGLATVDVGAPVVAALAAGVVVAGVAWVLQFEWLNRYYAEQDAKRARRAGGRRSVHEGGGAGRR